MLGFDALSKLPLAGSPLGQLTATLAATESSDVAAVNISAAHTASLTATEPADVASVNLSAAHTAALAATEASDAASIALSAQHTASFAVTETSDTASVALTAAHTASLNATESSDTATVYATVGNVVSVTVSATETRDTADVAIAAWQTAALAGLEAADIAAIEVALELTASLNATEANDVVQIVAVGDPPGTYQYLGSPIQYVTGNKVRYAWDDEEDEKPKPKEIVKIGPARQAKIETGIVSTKTRPHQPNTDRLNRLATENIALESKRRRRIREMIARDDEWLMSI